MALYSMEEGLWRRLTLGNAGLTHKDALAIALGTFFLRHCTPGGRVRDAG